MTARVVTVGVVSPLEVIEQSRHVFFGVAFAVKEDYCRASPASRTDILMPLMFLVASVSANEQPAMRENINAIASVFIG